MYRKMTNKVTPFQIIIWGFAGVILIGALLLMLPASSKSGTFTSFGQCLFTATSAVCVTGLVVLDTATHWSYFGQVIILILIQIGGLGVITVASVLVILAGKKIGLVQRQTMQNAISAPQVGGIVRMTSFIFRTSLVIEGLGTIFLIPVFVPKYGVKGIWLSVFHSISAFCNAGFDLMGEYSGPFTSLSSFADNGYLTIVISLLIIAGGIGYFTWSDIRTKKYHFSEYRMQTKLILITTLALLVIPGVFFFFTDFSDSPVKERLWLSVFQAVTPRTAGFNTADLTSLSDSGRAITMILMLIGGSPGSTAGGIKTTTLAILAVNTFAVFRTQKSVNCFGRRVDDSIIKNAATIAFIYLSISLISAIAISQIEGLPLQTCMFETFSAIGTVGLSMGITPGISFGSRVILILLMFFGRVGGLTIMYAAFSRRYQAPTKYPLENVMVG